jgi:glycerol kinase
MAVLVIRAGTTDVTARLVAADGAVVATGRHEVHADSPGPDLVEHQPEQLWRATLAAARDVFAAPAPANDAQAVTEVRVAGDPGLLVLWDRETLGAPRPAIGAADRRTQGVCERLRASGNAERIAALSGRDLDTSAAAPRLAWLAGHEPNTWALLEDGRYAVGPVGSYLVARLTRGTWHVTDEASAAATLLCDPLDRDWSEELCALFGVPRDALPDVVAAGQRVGTTDARSFLGLELPITLES